MIIHCSGCHKALEVDEERLTQDRLRGICPSCKTIIEVKRPDEPAQEPEHELFSLDEDLAFEDSEEFDESEYADAFQEENEPENFTEDDMAQEDEEEPEEEDVLEPASSGINTAHAEGPGTVGTAFTHSNEPYSPRKTHGMKINQKLLLLFLSFVLMTAGVLIFLYLSFVPAMLNNQIRLRTVSVAQAYAGSVQNDLLVKNYLQVNRTAMTYSKLPHVAYVSVLNKRGTVIAGIFGNKNRFDAEFQRQIESSGFPRTLANRNHIVSGKDMREESFVVGGEKVFEVALPIPETGGEAHVGIFTKEAESEVQQSLIPLIEVLVLLILAGTLAFLWVGRSISKPIRSLTEAAEKISIGEMDHPITVRTGGEIGALAESLERMRFSVNSAMERLMQHH